LTPVVAVVLLAIGVLAWLIATPLWRTRRRAAHMARPLAPGAAEAIDRNVPAVRNLPPELRARLESLMSAFLAEKQFIGCNGLVVSDEIRATIAALACLLVLGRRGHYDALHSILVYPAAFWVEDEVEDEAGVVEKRRRVLSGEAWDSSRIILSWEDVLEAAHDPGQGYNVALHEFAHYLDAEGLGLPSLPHPPSQERSPAGRVRAIVDWADDLAVEFQSLLDAVDRGEYTFLDPYAAEDEAEFFAVATEDFFERPVELRAAHPRLYALLQEFYALDPAAWGDVGTLPEDGGRDVRTGG
jgi:Mlc titration factor MtfA (ptsG expression regulator)